MVPALALIMVVTVATLAPVLAPHDPFAQNITARLRPPAWEEGGAWTHPLGTDQLGRDTVSRLIYGARVSLLVGFAGVAISGVLGTLLGLAAGFFAGQFDRLIMRLVDIQLAFPRILLAVTIVAMLGASVINLVIVLGISAWMDYARIVRAQVLSLRGKEYVLAARCLGLSDSRIMFRHILPNTLSPVIIVASASVASNIIIESSLSFLGLGVGSSAITWGTMLADARDYIEVQSWLAAFPGLAIMLVVLAVNLLGDWLRDVLDPRLRRAV
jgi:peptide/nickel transport system permease protein